MIPIKTTYPTHTLKLPSTGKDIRYRPFIEKERKVLLVSAESNEQIDILNAIKDIINSCCYDVDAETLPLFDIEYIFLQLRARSIGEIMKLNFICRNDHDGKQCGNVMKVDVDITTAKVEGLKTDLKIPFNDHIGVKMKYPSLSAVETNIPTNSRDYLYYVIAKSIDFIWEDNNIFYAKDYSTEDVIDTITNFTHNQFGKLEEFIADLPAVKKTFSHVCNKCKFDHLITLEGYQSFFI